MGEEKLKLRNNRRAMAKDTSVVHVLLRTAEAKNKTYKKKPSWINNRNCIENVYQKASGEISLNLFGDRLTEESKKTLTKFTNKFIEVTQHGNSESFLEVLQYALDNYDADDIVYFLEDDYIHRPGWDKIIIEGLERADYVTLYDHPDKYTGNPEILFHTKLTHWKYTHSTTMTFACRLQTLIYDAHIFQEMVTTGIPPDHHIWMHLTHTLHRRLATPIPGYSTHGESNWLSPCINWKGYV